VSIAEIITQSNHAFSARELAKLLGVHKLTIYRNVTAGRLKGFFVGASLRFDLKPSRLGSTCGGRDENACQQIPQEMADSPRRLSRHLVDSFEEVMFRVPKLLRDEFLRKCWDADQSWPLRAGMLRVSPGFENWKTCNEHVVIAEVRA
jgi:excisionase family DNA binding protein